MIMSHRTSAAPVIGPKGIMCYSKRRGMGGLRAGVLLTHGDPGILCGRIWGRVVNLTTISATESDSVQLHASLGAGQGWQPSY